MFAMLASLALVHQSLGKPFGTIQYVILLALVFLCGVIGSNATLKTAGMGASIWCIFFGIALRLVINRHAAWLKSSTYDLEFFIKVSIVLLAINLKSIGVTGAKALMISWVETLVIIPIVYAIGYYALSMKKEDSLITSCGVCICGSSAAMTIGDCVKADK